ncbi:MAG: hypothetical protein FJ044_01140 [Candidatus Cloacimonetes bacterium]|nr:hypothetical protein [Candidatus Cloacimonadota bacterium]
MDNYKEEKWGEFVAAAFKAAGLPEVAEEELEVGTYTNRQITERFRNDPLRLISLLMQLPDGNPASRRSILSFAVDLIEDT